MNGIEAVTLFWVSTKPPSKELILSEIRETEVWIFKLIHREKFNGESDPRLNSPSLFIDNDMVIRLNTKIGDLVRHPELVTKKKNNTLLSGY